MNAIVISDRAVFDSFVSGQVVESFSIVPPDHEPDFTIGKLLEVFYKSTSPGNEHYLGKVIENLGRVPSVPTDKPEVLKIIVQRAGAVDIARA